MKQEHAMTPGVLVSDEPREYVTVPCEPTEEMLDVLYNNMAGDDADGALIRGYRNLLAVSPAPTERVEQEPFGYATPRMIERMRKGQLCGVSVIDKPEDGHTVPVYTAPQPSPAPAAPDVAGLVEALEKIAAGERLVERDGRSEVENDITIDYPSIAIAALSAHRQQEG